ncbi:MAG: TolC family protein [Clostridium sp.]|nr:TolC family protein [Prevotella sp.]MCM1428565.1 TolC family protein [Clostridium sp.]
MNSQFAFLSTFTAALLFTSLAEAQTFSLDSCRSLALSNNKTIRMADQTVRAAGYERKSAHSAYLPGIDFTGGYMYNQHQIELLSADAKLPTMSFDPSTGKYNYNIVKGPDGIPVMDPASGSVIPTEVAVIPKEALAYDTHNVFFGAFTLTQPIYMGGKIRALNDIARYAESVARSSRNALHDEVVYSVDQAYWLVVSLRQKQELANSFVALMDSLRRNVVHLQENGMATKADLLNVEVKLNEAQIARTKLDNGLALARMSLARICGLPINTPMILSDEGLSATERKEEILPSYNMADVFQRRNDLEIIRQSINVLKGREKLVLGEMLPNIAAIGMYSFSNPNVNHGFEKRFGGGFSVGATLTIPLWHWGGRYNHYKAAQSATAAQRLLLEDAEQMVELQVSQARFKYSEAFKTLAMTRTNMEKANENLRQAQLAFKEGVMTADDVIAAQTAWVKAHSEEIDAEIDLRLCQVYLAKVLGQLQVP